MIRKFIVPLLSFGAFVIFSCSKEEIKPTENEFPLSFNFIKSEFKGDIQCYDTLGDIIDFVSPNFVRNDFLFTDGYDYPYDIINVAIDSTVLFCFTIKELLHVESGLLTKKNDTLYFFSGEYSRLIFKGVIVDQYLRIPAYGFKYSSIYGDYSGYSGIARFGDPNITELIEQFQYSNYKGLFIQRFDLLYEIDRIK